MEPNYREEGEPVSGYSGFSLLSILRTIWKRKVAIALTWALLTSCAIALVRILPAVYLSETVVLIDTQKIPEKFVSATVASDLEDRIAAIRETLLSSGELKKIIEDFGLYKEERKSHVEEEILDMMRKDIKITLSPIGTGTGGGGSRDKRTAAFRIGYQGADPQLVMRVANRLTDLYVEQNLKTRESQAEGTSAFLDTQLREAKKRLDELEATVSSYKLQHNGELPQQEQSLSGTLSRLQTELEANRDAINRAHQTKVILESTVNATEASIAEQTHAWEQAVQRQEVPGSYLPGQPSAAQPAKQSEALEDQLAQARAKFTEDHPEVIRLRKSLENAKRAEAQRQAAKLKTLTSSSQSALGGNLSQKEVASVSEPPEIARARQQLAGLTAQIKGADAEIEARKAEQQRILRDLSLYQGRIEHLPVREQEMAQITRDYEMSKENYKSLLDKKMAAEMALDMERRQQSERFTVLDRARLPEKPVKPNRPQLYAIGSGLALALALAVGFSAELRQNVVLGEWELPESVPVLARLPRIAVSFGSVQTKPRVWGWRLARGSASAVPHNG
jgi:polysaccharide chain length determinant protein (PEP-CTERM system associated)